MNSKTLLEGTIFRPVVTEQKPPCERTQQVPCRMSLYYASRRACNARDVQYPKDETRAQRCCAPPQPLTIRHPPPVFQQQNREHKHAKDVSPQIRKCNLKPHQGRVP